MRVFAALLTISLLFIIGAPTARATNLLTPGDTLDIKWYYPNFGTLDSDSGNFTYTGPGQVVQKSRDGEDLLYNDEIRFQEFDVSGYHWIPAAFNGPVVYDLTNGSAFSNWSVLYDGIGITSDIIKGGQLGVNVQGAPIDGAATIVGLPGAPVPEPAVWTLMITGLAALGAAIRGRRPVLGAS